MNQIELYTERFLTAISHFIPNLIAAIATLVIGLILIKLFRRFINSLMIKRELDPTLLRFIMDVMTWTFRVLLFVSVITKLGVETTSFVAAIGAAGLAIGLSLQGSLSNFAGGLLIILFKPFRVGHSIEAQNEAGTVQAIQIFSTKILTAENNVVFLPNGILSNGTIRNLSTEPLRRAEIVLTVDYDTSLKLVRGTLHEILKADTRILNHPAAVVQVRELTETSVKITVLLWSTRVEYGDVVSDFYEQVKLRFQEAGIRSNPPYQVLLRPSENPSP